MRKTDHADCMKGEAAALYAVRSRLAMKILNITKRLAAVLCCMAVTVGAMTAYAEAKYGSSNVSAAKTIPQIQEERKQAQAQIDELDKQIEALEGNKDKEKEYQETLMEQITLIQNNIMLLDEEIAQIGAEVTAAQDNIDALNVSIGEQQIKVNENIELFKERLCAMYVTGNQSLASAVLGSTDFYDMLSRMEMVNCIAEHDEELVNKILDDIAQLETSKSSLETEKLNLEMKQEEQETKRAERQGEIEKLNEQYQKTEEELERLELEKEKLNKSKDELEADIALFDKQEQEILDQIAAEEARKKAEEEKQQQASSGGNTTFETDEVIDTSASAQGFGWPVPGYYFKSSSYGSRWGRLHAGIDIAGGGIAGASVVASKGGTVIGVKSSCTHNYRKSGNCCGNGYGNYVIVSHGNGYTTLYGHLQAVSVSVGDTVSQGQVIGTVGCTGFSTGFHLHFEVRVNGAAKNPENYLP